MTPWPARYIVLLFFLFTITACTHLNDDDSISSIAEYRGSESCAACHPTETAQWKNSYHDLAMQEANDSTVLGDFENGKLSSKGITSRFYRKEKQFVVFTEGPDGSMQEFQVAYTFGVFPLQQYLVKFPGGRLQALHLAWDSKENKWFDLQPTERFRPDDWMHWTKGSMTWNNMCADCHSTNLQKNYNPASDTYATTWSIIDVSCEACHGPGSAHIEYVRAKSYRVGKKKKGAYLYLTPGLSNVEQVNQCARCHSLRSNQTTHFTHDETYLDQYLPEVPFPELYYPDGQILSEVYVFGSFTQSRMYHQGVKCTDCHNPHSTKVKFPDNRLCTQCHLKADFDSPSHHFHQAGGAGSKCVDCHMPGRIYMGNDFRRDHSLRVPRPDLSLRYNVPNACQNCHADKGIPWQVKAVQAHFGSRRKAHFSEPMLAYDQGNQAAGAELLRMVQDTAQNPTVQAMALRYMEGSGIPSWENVLTEALKSPHAQVRHIAVRSMQGFPAGARLTQLLPLLSDKVRSVRAQAAYGLADAAAQIPGAFKDDFERALKDYEGVLAAQADFTGGRIMLGQHRVHQGKMAEAENAFLSAMRMDQDHPPAVNALATFYYGNGRVPEAEKVYRQFLSRNPTEAWAYFDLGLLLAGNKRLPEAAQMLEKAAQLDKNPRYYYNWGLTLQNIGKRKEAEHAFKKGIEVGSEADYLLYALAVLYYQDKKIDLVKPIAAKLLAMDPRNGQYQQLARAIGQ